MMKYAVKKMKYGKLLVMPNVGVTMHFNQRDLAWLDAGNIPKLNKDGYMIMPYGNTKGKEVYNDIS